MKLDELAACVFGGACDGSGCAVDDLISVSAVCEAGREEAGTDVVTGTISEAFMVELEILGRVGPCAPAWRGAGKR